MEPSAKIALIIEICRRLANERWSVIDLTLKQFGLPTSDSWNSDAEQYVMSSVEMADDVVLLELGRHLGVVAVEGRSAVTPDFWRDGDLRLFISHLAIHKSFAAKLQGQLSSYAISSFVAHKDIEPTRAWEDEIESALATCDAALALMHHDFHLSKWVDQELGFVMGRGVPILTARLGEDPYGFLGRFQALKYQNEDAIILADEIFRVLAANKKTCQLVTASCVARFESSGSFADAKLYFSRLERVLYWNQAYSARVRAAVANNYEIREAFGVPEKVEIMLRGFEVQGRP